MRTEAFKLHTLRVDGAALYVCLSRHHLHGVRLAGRFFRSRVEMRWCERSAVDVQHADVQQDHMHRENPATLVARPNPRYLGNTPQSPSPW